MYTFETSMNTVLQKLLIRHRGVEHNPVEHL